MTCFMSLQQSYVHTKVNIRVKEDPEVLYHFFKAYGEVELALIDSTDEDSPIESLKIESLSKMVLDTKTLDSIYLVVDDASFWISEETFRSGGVDFHSDGRVKIHDLSSGKLLGEIELMSRRIKLTLDGHSYIFKGLDRPSIAPLHKNTRYRLEREYNQHGKMVSCVIVQGQEHFHVTQYVAYSLTLNLPLMSQNYQ